MLRGGDVQEVQELRRQGLSITKISTLTGFDRKTIRKYLDDPKLPRYGPRPKRGSRLEPFHAYLDERLAAGVWNAVVLLRELRARGYGGGYTVLKDYLRPLRREAATVAVRRFETPPGHQAQLDWGTIGHLQSEAGNQTLYAFVLTLGHSRAMFSEVATDTRLGTLLRLHEAAFAALGGVPQQILYDRMKTVMLGTDERGEIKWHPQFLDFARYWGFVPRVCAAYRPQTKGKVESGVGYVKKNFVTSQRGLPLHDLGQLRAGLHAWVAEVANQRVHGTTGRHVFAAWQAERRLLLPYLGRAAYPFAGEERRKVSRDAFVSYRGNRYSVPWPAAGQEVLLQEDGNRLSIGRGGERLTVHELGAPGARETITIAAHHEGIPLSFGGSTGKAQLLLQMSGAALPEVEVRPLWAYEQYGRAHQPLLEPACGEPAPDFEALLDGLELNELELAGLKREALEAGHQ